MRTFFWIMSKIGPLMSFLTLALLFVPDDNPIILYVLGGVCALFGLYFGVKAYSYNVSPSVLWFLSSKQIFDNQVASALVWAFRFLGVPAFFYGLITYIGS